MVSVEFGGKKKQWGVDSIDDIVDEAGSGFELEKWSARDKTMTVVSDGKGPGEIYSNECGEKFMIIVNSDV